MKVDHDEEDLGLVLQCPLPFYYVNFKNTILYNSDTFTLDEVFDVLFSKKKTKHLMIGSEA